MFQTMPEMAGDENKQVCFKILYFKEHSHFNKCVTNCIIDLLLYLDLFVITNQSMCNILQIRGEPRLNRIIDSYERIVNFSRF